MPLQHEGPAPYAPPATVVQVIERARAGTLPTPVDVGVLQRIGVPASLAPRTLAGLKQLELIDDAGQPQALDALRRARPDEYGAAAADWLRSVYSEVFGIIGDPANATYDQLEHAFWGYTPAGQRPRMVTLFIGLCELAGLLPEESPLRAAVRTRRSATKSPARPASRRTAGRSRRESQAEQTAEDQEKEPLPEPHVHRRSRQGSDLDPMIAGLIGRLPPPDSEWPRAKRRAWLNAAEAAFNVLYELPADDHEEVAT